jgi:pimeloyl-ACP methyl ester carboxylesterase
MAYLTFRAVSRANHAYICKRSIPERLAVPDLTVLVVFGAADPRWYPSSARRYGVVPDARIEMLPGIGHVPMLEAPQATGDLLLDFPTTTFTQGS